MSGVFFFILLLLLGAAALLAFLAQIAMIIFDVGLSWVIGNTFIGGLRVMARADALEDGRKPPPDKPFGHEVSVKEAFWVNFFVGKRMWLPWLLSILLLIGTVIYGVIALLDRDRVFTAGDFTLIFTRSALLCAFLVGKSYLSGLYIGASLCAIIYNLVEHDRWRGLPGIIKAVNWAFGSVHPFWESAYWWCTSIWTGLWTLGVALFATMLIATKGDIFNS